MRPDSDNSFNTEVVNCYVCGSEVPKMQAQVEVAGPHQNQEFHCPECASDTDQTWEFVEDAV